jgi:hypothetical protein
MEFDLQLDFINSYMRVLTLLFGFKDKKSFQMTFDKLILYDFFLKYPVTMFGESEKVKSYDFDELYSYYHSEPDRDSYHKILRFLISKKLVDRIISNGSFVYQITTVGEELILSIESPYSTRMIECSRKIAKTVATLSDLKVKEVIHLKTKENIKHTI